MDSTGKATNTEERGKKTDPIRNYLPPSPLVYNNWRVTPDDSF
jgi:hypothetical protein